MTYFKLAKLSTCAKSEPLTMKTVENRCALFYFLMYEAALSETRPWVDNFTILQEIRVLWPVLSVSTDKLVNCSAVTQIEPCFQVQSCV